MSTHANRVQMSVSGTPGTGTITLNAATTGYRSFASAYGGNATVDVLIVDGTAWEVARDCTYTNSGTTLTRGTLESSSTGSAISLTSSAVVSVIPTADWGNRIEALLQQVTPGGRLTTESGVPVSTSDRTAQSTIYYTPYVHNGITLWDGANWRPITFTEVSLALSGLTASRPYDVFGFLNSGALNIELLAWTNDTTRATAVTLQDGRYCKSGDKTRLLLGTIYTTGTTTTADSKLFRYVANLYNAIARSIYEQNSTSHTYTTATWREWNGGSGISRCNFVLPLANSAARAFLSVVGTRSGASGQLGFFNIGLDAVDGTNNLVSNMEATATSGTNLAASVAFNVVAGRHYLSTVEYGFSGVTYQVMTLSGDVFC